MEKIQAWKTTDGKLWETEGIAAKHERDIRRECDVANWVAMHWFDGMGEQVLIDAIIKNRDELKTAIGEK